MTEPSSSALQAGDVPDARAARDSKGHFNQAFKLAAVRYALGCGKSQRAAAREMGVSDKTLGGWVCDARPRGGPSPGRKPRRGRRRCREIRRTRPPAGPDPRSAGGQRAADRRTGLFKKSGGLLRGPVPGRFKVIHDNRHVFAVALMCDLLGVSRQGYYDWTRRVRRKPSARSVRREQIVAAIRRSHAASRGRYGSPRIHSDLLEQGIACCVNTVARRMREHGIASTVRRKFRVTTTDSNHDHSVFANRLDRQFGAGAPDRKWAADITYVPTGEGFLYLAGVVDLYSRRIVGWCMKETLHADLCVEALEMALARRRPVAGLLHHSDRGCQYASDVYQDKLDAFGLQCSMSGVANCWDNAVVESLWASLKTELVYQEKFATRQAARDAIFEWIEVWYNRQRRHSALGYVSPAAFEAVRN